MVRADVVRQRLDVLLDALSDLRRYRLHVTKEALVTDRDTQHMVSHALYVAAQAAIDLALHALADAEAHAAPTYQDAFRGLAGAGRLDRALAERLAGWAGFRNVLAHHYASVDYELVHVVLVSELDDLERFAAVVASWLDGG
jgi:uncharacterized protein YutE (UPF0331/DUF86 family)